MKKLISIILLLIIYACANQLPPSGGPVDREPPEIVKIYPEDGTLNFNDEYFEFTFSEYVDKRSFMDAFFISPKIDSKLNYDWSGKSVRIYFDKNKLLKNTTYSINIGTDLFDLNNRNRAVKSYNVSFSTGDKLDEGRISGKIYFNNDKDVFIFAYKDRGDTINPTKSKPDYLTMINKDGYYGLSGLGYGNYKIFAFTDEMRDLLYNIGEDKYGVPFTDVNLDENKTNFSGVNMILSKEDTLNPSISSITMTDKNHILVEFSEYIDSTNIKANNFYIMDSTKKIVLPVKYLFKNTRPKTYFICFNDSLNTLNEYYLIGEGFKDLSGNISLKQELPINVSSLPDTTKPKLISIITKYENKTIDLEDPYFIVNFNDGINLDEITLNSKAYLNVKDELKLDFKKIDDATLKVEIKSKLKPSSKINYSYKVNNVLDAAGNKLDTLYKVDLNTVDDLIFSGVSGKVKSSKNSKKIIKLENTNNKYEQELKEKNEFNFTNVMPGKYILWIYEDKDSNNVYSPGKVIPYIKSEKFYVYPDTLNLRARWPVGDVEIDFD